MAQRTNGNQQHDKLQAALQPIQRRLRWQQSLTWLSRGALIGVACGIGLAVSRLLQLPVDPALLILIAGLPAVICGIAGLIEERTLAESARAADENCGLKNRAATALQLSRQQGSLYGRLQVHDAIRHLGEIRPNSVVSAQIPSDLRLAAAGCVIILLVSLVSFPAAADSESDSPVRDRVVTQVADSVQEQLQDLAELAEETNDEELQTLADQLQKDLKGMRLPGVTRRDMMAQLSDMRYKLQNAAEDLNVEQMNAQLTDVAEALAHAKETQAAAEAIKDGDLQRAGSELEKIDGRKLNRAEARALSDEVAQAADKAGDRNLDEVADTLDDLADATADRNSENIEEGAERLAEQIRQHSVRRKLGKALEQQNQLLAQSKKNLALHSNSEGDGSGANASGLNEKKGTSEKTASSPSRKAGGKSSGNKAGEKTRLDGQLQMARLAGQMTNVGDSQTEKVKSVGGDEQATRLAQDTFSEYQKLSDAVLDAEPIPQSQRRMIRRYFELIRPTREELSSAEQ